MSDSQTNNNSKFSFDPSTAKPVETTLVAKSEGFNFDPSSAKEEKKGFKGHIQDTSASLMSGLAAVPDTLVGLADMYTEGRAGKAIDDNLGEYYKLGNAQNYWQDQKTDIAKEQQQQFHEADGIVDKTKVALQNPSMIANAAVESLPSMFLGGMLGKASKIANPVVGAAVGEGAVMAGAQAEQIRQNSDDHMLNNGQEAAAALTGGLGALFGFAGGRIAQKLGIGDVDTMLVNGRVGPAQIAGEIANTPAKSLPRRVIEGAISEGFLEELPQSISEQIIQNLATDKHWSDGVEDAAVMGTLAGMAMGGVANIPSGHNPKTAENNTTPEQSQAGSVSPLPQLGGGSQSLDGEFIPRAEQRQNNADGNRTNYEYTQFNTDASNRLENNGFDNAGTSDAPLSPQPNNDGGSYFENQRPSERLGLNPDNGPMSSAAALAVDNGVSPFTPDVATNTSLPSEYKQLLPQQSQNNYQSDANQSKTGNLDNQSAQNAAQDNVTAKPVFSSTETAGTMSYAKDITNQALEHYKNDNAELTDRKSSLTGKGAATDLIYYKNSPSFSDVEVVDAGDKSIVKLTNAKTGQVTEREYPQALVGFNNFMESNNANGLTQNDSATVDEVSKLEQQLLDTKSVVKKAQIRKQIETLKSQDLPQVEKEQSQKSKAIEQSANEAATSPLNDVPAPTQAQIEAGNYKKGHVRLHGLDITVENPKGSDRAGKRPDGTEWSHTMSDHYGYIKRTQGADSEQVDTYIGNNPDSDQVYIVDQLDQVNGGFDEHKVMLGFDSHDAAIKAYKSNFDDGWKVGPVRSMNVAQFKDWLKNGDTTKPSVANKLPSKNEQKKLDSTLNDVKTVNRAQVGYDLAKKSGNRIIYSDNKGQIDTADIVVNNFSVKGHEFYLALGTDKQSLGKYKVISEHGLTVGGFHATETDAMKAFNEKINSISDKQLQEAFERAGKIVQESGKSQDDLKQQFERSLYVNNTNDSPQKLAESSAQAKDSKVSNTKDSQSIIQDLGEKIGGARKDTSLSTGRTPKAKKSDDRPTWAKRYEISEIAASTNSSEVGKWVVEDTKKSDWKGNPKQLGKFDSEEEAKQMLPILVVAQKHRIYARRESEGGYEIWRQINDTKRVKVVNEIFDSKDSAQKYLVKNAISILETNTTFGESDIPRPQNTIRHGVARRTGDVKDKDFMDVFGFRGVEFGNWNNQVERQQLLNDAYDGLLDLADVLKIPAKAISLNGDLALAFGARGQGLSSARAHYEPGKAVINLTKMNGAGSLAHEWWHAFDHFLARQDGKASAEWVVNTDGTRNLKVSKNSNDNMVSAGFSYRNSGVREDVRNAFTTVMETMTSKAEQYVEDTQQVDNFVGKARDLVSQRLDAIRKELERELDTKYYKRFYKAASTEQLVEFDSIAQQLKNGELLNTEWRSDVKNKSARGILSGARWTNDALEKLSSIYKAVRGRSGFSNEQKGILDQLRSAMNQYSSRLKLLAEAQQGTTKVKKIPTQFVMNAKDLDTGRGSDYWTTPHELSARAFQGFVEDKISEVSGKSPFLNYAPENIAIETPWGWVRPFPHGKERKAINEKLDALVDTLKTETTKKGIRLYSRNMNPNTQLEIKSNSEVGQTHFIPSYLVDQPHKLVDVVEDISKIHTEGIKSNHQYAVKLLNEIAKLNPNVFVHIVSDLNSIEDTSIRANLAAGGFFVPKQNTVYLYPESDAWNSSALELLNHELVHSITEQYISQGLMSREDINQLNNFINIINDYRMLSYQNLSDDVRDRLDYAVTTNPHHEILSVGIAESAVRQELEKIIGYDGLQRLNNIFLNISNKVKQYEQYEQRTNSGKNTEGNNENVSKPSNGVSEKIQKGFVKTESDNGIKRDTGNPSGDISGNENSKYSNTQLEADNNFEWTASINRVFGIFTQSRAIDRIISFFNHFKMSTTQDATVSGRISVTLGGYNVNNVGDLDTTSFTVQVISSFDKLPKIIQDNATYQDENGVTNNYSVSGVWHNDTLYIVTDQIYGNLEQQLTTSDAYEELLAHEVIGHLGVQQLFGDEYQLKFQQLYNVLGGIEGIRKIAKNNGVDMQQFENAYIEPFKKGVEEGYYSALDAQQAVIGELFAFIAQNAETRPFVRQKLKEVIGYIRQWFRDHGFSKFLSRYNDADLMMFLSEARKAVVDRRYFGKFKDQTISTNNSDQLFSRGQSTTRTDTTVKQVRDKLVSRFGEETISKLEIQGKLNILDTYEKAGIEGFYQSGKATLIADALTNDTIIPTFLHELGGHGGFQNMMDAKQYDDLMRQFDRLVAQNNPIALEAKRLAERETDPEVQHLEMLPYLLTLASNNQIKNAVHKGNVKRLISDLKSKIKAWVYDRLGVNLNLDTNDIVALAERMIDKGTTKTAQSNQPLYSRSTNYTDITDRISNGFKNLPKAGQWVNNKGVDWLKLGLQALSRRHITEIYSKILPQLIKYNELAAQMDADKNDIAAEADNIVREWSKLKDEETLANLMHDATLAQLDPAKPYQSGDDKAKYQRLLRAYNNLSPEAQAMYVKARDAYKKHYAKVHQAIKERILRSELSSQKKADLMKKMDDNFFNGRIKGVYFPLARFGQYVVVVRNGKGDVESVSRAETMNEAESVRNELLKKYPQSKVDQVKLDKEFNASRDGVGRGFMSDLFNEVGNLGLDKQAQAEFEDTLSQLYLSSMPDLSWAKHGIHRKGTAGFSQDARRAFAQNMFSGANYLGKLRYGDQLAQQLDEMQKYSDEQFKVDDHYDQRSAQRVIGEMNKRHDNLMNPKGHPLSSFLTSVGFMYYMGLSPAAAIVNISQTALVAYPLMGAKWGYDKAGKELIEASKDFAKGIEFNVPDFSSLESFKNSIGNVYSPNIDKVIKGLELDAYNEAVKRGVIDVTQAHDLAGIAQGEDSKVMWYFRPAMRLASGMFHHAERFNREVTFIAAYRLASQAGATQTEAFEQAMEMVYRGHFDYSAGNRARFMQGNFAKVVLLFKQYAQNMIYTLVRNAHQSLYAIDPNEQREARRALAGILGMHALAAGAIGLPITGMLATASILIAKKSKLGAAAFSLAALAALASGGDDDDPYELENVIRNWLADIHPKFADLVFGGIPRAFTPVDLSGRVGINNLIIPDVQDGLEGADWAKAMQSALLGPVVGIGTNLAKGFQEINDGDYGRGIETMLPVVLKNAMKSMRFANEGVLTKNKDIIQEEVNSVGIFSQAIGFSPSDVRTSMEGRSAIYQYKTKLENHRKDLMRKWVVARQEDDGDSMNKAWAEILEFNEKVSAKNPSARINRINLMQSYKSTERRAKETGDGGVYLTKRQQVAEEQGGFAFDR
ncbi:PLxRFG domain-containing protein [Acinetobacter modestus]|uniref:PLxRFG domain-containing protein n=1 Tax=Acinetobacter modestus TaxID=1776740 RepID=UPI00301A9AE8